MFRFLGKLWKKKGVIFPYYQWDLKFPDEKSKAFLYDFNLKWLFIVYMFGIIFFCFFFTAYLISMYVQVLIGTDLFLFHSNIYNQRLGKSLISAQIKKKQHTVYFFYFLALSSIIFCKTNWMNTASA